MLDGLHKVQHEELDVQPDVSYKEEAKQILDRSVKTIRRKEMFLVKVLWS